MSDATLAYSLRAEIARLAFVLSSTPGAWDAYEALAAVGRAACSLDDPDLCAVVLDALAYATDRMAAWVPEASSETRLRCATDLHAAPSCRRCASR